MAIDLDAMKSELEDFFNEVPPMIGIMKPPPRIQKYKKKLAIFGKLFSKMDFFLSRLVLLLWLLLLKH
jgi:hypothetical protein